MSIIGLLSAARLLCFAAVVTGQGVGSSGLTIDVDYGIYTGAYNQTSRLNVWKGIRYAAPPVGKLRWQPPQAPTTSRTPVRATAFGPNCPQSFPQTPTAVFIPGNEDCLYLNVYAPARQGSSDDQDQDREDDWRFTRRQNAGRLPVVVWIHGGGYGLGDGKQDPSAFINTNDNGMVAVVIQYRLGAFGFAASPEIKNRGVLNAGLMDQYFALSWIQKHIAKFGGDPDRVTIAGESAGAGSVLLHSIAWNASIGTKLFKNIIAASPWVPTQPAWNDAISLQHYNDFAKAAGCASSVNGTLTNATENVFDCLVAKDSLALQVASNKVSTSPPTPHANWAFIPVTDGTYVTGPPSVLLQDRKVNGLRALIGNNANEGTLIVPNTIATQDDLVAWMKSYFTQLSDDKIREILAAYPSSSGRVNPADSRYDTSGYGPGTAVNISQAGTGQQQRAYNLYAEASGGCHSYWFASAFSTAGHSAWHYQYSVPFAVHGADISAYWGPPTPNQTPELVTAFRRIFGNFIINNSPSISNVIANGASSPTANSPNPASDWPKWIDNNPMQLNLNITGGTPYTTLAPNGVQVVQFAMPGVRNNISLANAYTWEGGRGQRCEVWKVMSPLIPQ